MQIVAPATKSYFRAVNKAILTFTAGVMVPKVGKTAKFLSMMIKSHFAAHNLPLTKEQFLVLLCLEDGCQSQSFLTVITERDKGSLARLIQSLEKKSYVIRNTHADDNRVNEVELTVLGKEILEETKPIMKHLFELAQKGITESEMELVTGVLEKMQANAMHEIDKIEETKKRT
jgi:DNA-binding MarR family transcriptional regulator